MGWLKKAIGSPGQARRVVEDAKKDVRRPKKDEVSQQRAKKQQGGRSK